jgi:hypothetical protein
MTTCTRCGSHAINPGRHGRDYETRLNLCDVCYWREEAERLHLELEECRKVLRKISEAQDEINTEAEKPLHQRSMAPMVKKIEAIKEARRLVEEDER